MFNKRIDHARLAAIKFSQNPIDNPPLSRESGAQTEPRRDPSPSRMMYVKPPNDMFTYGTHNLKNQTSKDS